MDRGAWQATVYRVAKSQAQLKQLSTPPFFLRVKNYFEYLTYAKLKLYNTDRNHFQYNRFGNMST